jgi:hypothetical protein
VAVVGPTDVGKSTFIQALAERAPERCIVDLDPGQKMIGPPGTATLGRVLPERRLDRLIFHGSTAIGSFRALAEAAATLAAGAERGFIVNTSGYVHGPGARMQAMVLDALAPDLIVSIGTPPALEPVLAGRPSLRIARSELARRKSPTARAAVRQAAFDEALLGAEPLELEGAAFEPGPPLPLADEARPICALADDEGEDMLLGVLTSVEPLVVHALPPPRPPRHVRLGKMWAAPSPSGWTLLDRLVPAAAQ